jgi:hypothetical protein
MCFRCRFLLDKYYLIINKFILEKVDVMRWAVDTRWYWFRLVAASGRVTTVLARPI